MMIKKILLGLAFLTPVLSLAADNQNVMSYPYVHIQNTTDYGVDGTVHYASFMCSNDSFHIKAHSSWTASSRGVCLVTKINAENTNTDKSGTAYESSGTSYSQFVVYDNNGVPSVTRKTDLE
ncbi:hypothetical protein [Fangia hongkongensis]|uniref:hypothetical protein n=1 Tax=Fangia hongkongensis TaxID=270495 RepID=UPI00035E030F|nr:hypothetical protein [Fangia hongkongensis]